MACGFSFTCEDHIYVGNAVSEWRIYFCAYHVQIYVGFTISTCVLFSFLFEQRANEYYK